LGGEDGDARGRSECGQSGETAARNHLTSVLRSSLTGASTSPVWAGGA
jgi:hypothetical protein